MADDQIGPSESGLRDDGPGARPTSPLDYPTEPPKSAPSHGQADVYRQPSESDPPASEEQPAQRKLRKTWLSILVLLLIAAWLCCAFVLPRLMYWPLTDAQLDKQNVPTGQRRIALKDAEIKLQNDIRTTLLQGLGPVLLLVGAGIGAVAGWQQVSLARQQMIDTLKHNTKELELSREQMDRTFAASEQQRANELKDRQDRDEREALGQLQDAMGRLLRALNNEVKLYTSCFGVCARSVSV
jgi:hypothetical protein